MPRVGRIVQEVAALNLPPASTPPYVMEPMTSLALTSARPLVCAPPLTLGHDTFGETWAGWALTPRDRPRLIPRRFSTAAATDRQPATLQQLAPEKSLATSSRAARPARGTRVAQSPIFFGNLILVGRKPNGAAAAAMPSSPSWRSRVFAGLQTDYGDLYWLHQRGSARPDRDTCARSTTS